MNHRACLLASVVSISMACLSGCGSTEGSDDEDATVEGEESSASALSASDYPAPNLSLDQKLSIFANYHLDTAGVVPRTLLVDAVAFFDANKAKIRNKGFLTVVDFSKHSGKQRLWVVNMTSGAVSGYVVAHGAGSDPGSTGFATKFSNTENSNQTSLGYYVTGETYDGKHGNSLRLDGVSSTNNHARERAIVMHGADYVGEGRSKQGRSWGCLALPTNEKDGVIAKLKGGSVIYAAHPN